MCANMKMPVIFVGHGSPMNALGENPWREKFASLSSLLPRPKAIIAISAHWFIGQTMLTGQANPRTIHDFYGFQEELYRLTYPAPGDPLLAAHTAELVGSDFTRVTDTWGLDHGTWTVLMHLYPEADIPVVQLSIDGTLSPSRHLELGARLKPLRDEGVLIFASGNIVHNLSHVFMNFNMGRTGTPDWAVRFDAAVAKALTAWDRQELARLIETEDGVLSHPTPDHYLPLLYAAGAADSRDRVAFPITGFDMGSLSMRAAIIG